MGKSLTLTMSILKIEIRNMAQFILRFSMIKQHFLVAVILLAALPLTAKASIVVGFTGNANLTGVSFTPNDTGLSLIGEVGNDPSLSVSAMSDLVMMAQGSTTLNNNANSGSQLFTSNLMIAPTNFFGFRNFQQNLDFTGTGSGSSENNGLNVKDVRVTVFYTDSNGLNPTSTFTDLDFENAPMNSDRYDVFTTMGEIITKIQLENLNGALVSSSKQIRIDPDSIVRVPEPSSLVMFASLIGCCCLRRRYR